MTDKIRESPYYDAVSGQELLNAVGNLIKAINVQPLTGEELKDLLDISLREKGLTPTVINTINTTFFALREEKMANLRSNIRQPSNYSQRHQDPSHDTAPEDPFSHGRHIRNS